MFRAVNPQVNSEVINKLEQQQLDFWRFNRVFERTTIRARGCASLCVL